jgi:hypothetical protein
MPRFADYAAIGLTIKDPEYISCEDNMSIATVRSSESGSEKTDGRY